jgi:hypothetical protein
MQSSIDSFEKLPTVGKDATNLSEQEFRAIKTNTVHMCVLFLDKTHSTSLDHQKASHILKRWAERTVTSLFADYSSED